MLGTLSPERFLSAVIITSIGTLGILAMNGPSPVDELKACAFSIGKPFGLRRLRCSSSSKSSATPLNALVLRSAVVAAR